MISSNIKYKSYINVPYFASESEAQDGYDQARDGSVGLKKHVQYCWLGLHETHQDAADSTVVFPT